MEKMKKKTYSQPQSAVTRVELESPICSGSVQFGGETTKIDIEAQGVNADTNNDFSSQEWTIDNNN